MSAKASPPAMPQDVSQAHIDSLLQGAGTEDAPPKGPGNPQPAADADEVVISQADIDALLQAASAPVVPSVPAPAADHRSPNADGDGAEEIFISQADIDALMASEDLVESEAIDTASPVVSAAREPQAPAADPARLSASQEPRHEDEQAGGLPAPSAGRDGAGPQKVILAPSDGERSPSGKAPEANQPAAKRWLASKTLWAVAAVLLVLISTVTSFTIYGRRTPARGAGGGAQVFPIAQATSGAQAPDPSGPALVALAGFVVPAPPDKEGVAGLLVDVQLAFSDAAAGSEIKKHEPYFRSLVYAVLSAMLADRGRPEIDEVELVVRIKDALNRALPQADIRTVALENLRLL